MHTLPSHGDSPRGVPQTPLIRALSLDQPIASSPHIDSPHNDRLLITPEGWPVRVTRTGSVPGPPHLAGGVDATYWSQQQTFTASTCAPNANYSSASVNQDMSAAVGLTPRSPPQSPRFGPLAQLPWDPVPGPVYAWPAHPFHSTTSPSSRTSTGRNPLFAALDGIPSPRIQGTAPNGDTIQDLEECAPAAARAANWAPSWAVFPIKVYRGKEFQTVDIKSDWDDEVLLRELGHAYNALRKWTGRWFLLKGTWYLMMVKVDRSFTFPQRVGPARYSAHRNMRMRHLLEHPECVAGQRQLMHALTEQVGFGVEFVERVVFSRVLILSVGLCGSAFAIAVIYGLATGDWPSAFGIASFFSQTFAILVGVVVACLHLDDI
ncbi:hypothetical protein C8Q80DRAFT_1269947 [Daedaleopsis nitida]|nr:hypothetical protein C8Q80DRAFT_1269947 [Daedaleopsis nitida]